MAQKAFMTGVEKTMLTLGSSCTVCLLKHLQVSILQVYKEVVNIAKAFGETDDVIDSLSILNWLFREGAFMLFGIFHSGISDSIYIFPKTGRKGFLEQSVCGGGGGGLMLHSFPRIWDRMTVEAAATASQ